MFNMLFATRIKKGITLLSKNKSTTNSYGFTLVELLIVIMVIGILSALVLSSINSEGIRGKSRDGQRAADLKKIQAALELYFVDNRSYPAAGSWEAIDGSSAIETALEGSYISELPLDPKHNTSAASPCVTGAEGYRYNYWSDGNKYVISAITEVSTSAEGHACSDLNVWSTASCGTVIANCYGVESP